MRSSHGTAYAVDLGITTGPNASMKPSIYVPLLALCRRQSFVDSMVIFVDRRIGALVEALSPKDAACALARRLRRHVQAHDAFTAALRIRAGRTQTPENRGGDCSDRSRGEEVVDDEQRTAPGGDGDEGVEEHDVQASLSKDALRLSTIYSMLREGSLLCRSLLRGGSCRDYTHTLVGASISLGPRASLLPSYAVCTSRFYHSQRTGTPLRPPHALDKATAFVELRVALLR